MLTSFICKGCGKPSVREKSRGSREPQYCTNDCYHASPAGRRRRGPVALPGTKGGKPTRPKLIAVPASDRARVRRWLAVPALYMAGGSIA